LAVGGLGGWASALWCFHGLIVYKSSRQGLLAFC